MTTRFEPVAGLDYIIAEKMGVPTIRRVLDMLTDEAQSRAPDCKVWVTMRDERVRPSHFKADTQTIPSNLRFRLEAADGSTDLAREPRDPNLPPAQRINCRCDSPHIDHPLRDSIHSGDIDHRGTYVGGTVETRFPLAAESEFGTDEDEAARFMRGALDEVALRLRSAHSR